MKIKITKNLTDVNPEKEYEVNRSDGSHLFFFDDAGHERFVKILDYTECDSVIKNNNSETLTKRELFAKDIMVGLLNRNDCYVSKNTDIDEIASKAIQITDILIEALNETNKN